VARTRCVAVDWSGAKKPKRKLALAEAAGGMLERLDTFDSREAVIDALGDYASRPEPVVVGLDFSFSLPAWFIRGLGISDAFGLWARVRDEGEAWLAGASSGPFWGRPGRRRPELEAHFRETERDARDTLGLHAKSVFQIGGAGAVGTGSVRGMPHLLRCREAGFAIWPFEDATDRSVIEIYPRALTGPVVKSSSVGRREYLERSAWRLSPEQVSRAAATEDLFDAAISALVMDANAAALRALPSGNTIDALEGRIWIPEPIRAGLISNRRSSVLRRARPGPR